MPAPTCKVCDTGTLEPRKRYRMGPVVVFIGWILLIPSILGVGGAAIGFVTSLGAGSAAATAGQDELDRTRLERMTEQFGERFDQVALPREYISLAVETPEAVTAESTKSLTPESRVVLEQLVSMVNIDRSAGEIGGAAVAGLGAFFFAILGVGSLVSGLLGWLLVQKKRVLQCVKCSAVVAAS
jgi:hypothetical protein